MRMAIVPSHYFDAVVCIGVPGQTENKQNKKWIGTGFLVGRKEEGTDGYRIFLITNYHVIENKENIYVRFNKKGKQDTSDFTIPLTRNRKDLFSKHPNLDIISIQLSVVFLEENDSEFSFFALDNNALDLKQMNDTGVLEGTIIYSLGFPMNMVGTHRKTPICRIGCISRISDLIDIENNDTYLIDLHAVPGNSGAPVINRPEIIALNGTPHNQSANLIGMICGSINYSEKYSGSENDIPYEQNSGIAKVCSVDSIKEVVEYEYERTKRTE